MAHKSIFAPILQIMDEINSFMMSMNPEKAKIYYSSDTTCQNEADKDMLALLALKIGTPIMLLRNIDHSTGLCNGTRLVKVFIPRIMLTPSDHRIPFRFQKRQFSIMVSYAMLINKSQGQSLSNVGLVLKKPVFIHGQLYVVVSRVTHRRRLKVLICHDNHQKKKTDNMVYKEVFQNVD
ncbi:hypothetical protein AAHE18_07G084700 [Arachis hypogaea]